MSKRTLKEIEDEMKKLYPIKEVAYLDFLENTGADEDTRDKLWFIFVSYRDTWNKLVIERKKLLGIPIE